MTAVQATLMFHANQTKGFPATRYKYTRSGSEVAKAKKNSWGRCAARAEKAGLNQIASTPALAIKLSEFDA